MEMKLRMIIAIIGYWNHNIQQGGKQHKIIKQKLYKYIKEKNSMASVQKRKQLVNQLRKAHFPFGFQQSNQQSQYTAKYPTYNGIAYQQANGNKKNNFSIGNENDIDIGAYKSQFKDKFPQYSVKGKQQAIGAKNVGVNNIVFGYGQQRAYQTNYKDDFEKKAIQNNRVKPGDLKKNNIEFGDSLSDFTTTYNKVFDQRNIQNGSNLNSTRNGFNDRRKSNLMLGNDKVMFETQNNITYKNTSLPGNKHVHKESNTSNVMLSTGNGNYTSESKARFTINGKPEREVVQKQTIRDFRNAHFNFGFPQEKPNFQSEAKNQFNKKPIEVVHVQGRKPSNINLNVDGNNYFESSYGREFADWGVQPLPQASKNARKDNVLIGTDVDPKQRYISQAKDNFGSKPIDRIQPIIAQGTLKLGEEETDFRTHNQLTYDDKFNRSQNTRLTRQDINRMKTLNIVTGFSGNSYNLHSSQYGKQQGERGQLPKETLSKMKNTNIVLQTVPINIGADTSYKTSYAFKINNDY